MLTTINLGLLTVFVVRRLPANPVPVVAFWVASSVSLGRSKRYAERNLYRLVLRKRWFRIEKVRWYAALYSATF